MSPFELPQAVNRAILDFLGQLASFFKADRHCEARLM